MLQRTRAANVEPIWLVLTTRWPSPTDLSQSAESDVLQVTKALGLAWRGRNLRAIAIALVERFGGNVPIEQEALEQLPGVGPYAATATGVMAFGRTALVVDSNVVRLFGRLLGFAWDPETRRRAWFLELVRPYIPTTAARSANLAMLDLTGTVCTPLRPRCDRCPLRARCNFAERMVNA